MHGTGFTRTCSAKNRGSILIDRDPSISPNAHLLDDDLIQFIKTYNEHIFDMHTMLAEQSKRLIELCKISKNLTSPSHPTLSFGLRNKMLP